MWVKWLFGLLVVIAGAAAYHTATNVSRGDIVAYSDLSREVHLDRFKPGDIVAVSADGSPVEVICPLQTTREPGPQVPVELVYFNSLGNIIPSFSQLMPSVTGAAGTVVDLADLADAAQNGGSVFGIAFSGYRSNLPRQTRAGIPADCNCKMADRIRLGQRACTVNKVLNEANGNWQAVGLATYSNIVPRAEFERCNVSLSRVPLAYFSKPPKCHEFVLTDWDVQTRSWLKVIKARSTVEE